MKISERFKFRFTENMIVMGNIAKFFCVDGKTIRKIIDGENQIHSIKIDHGVMVSKDDFVDWIERNEDVTVSDKRYSKLISSINVSVQGGEEVYRTMKKQG